MPHLLLYCQEPIDRRKLLPDPENEPDFYAISGLFPLPGDRKGIIEEARAALASRGIQIDDQIVERLANNAPSSSTLPQPVATVPSALQFVQSAVNPLLALSSLASAQAPVPVRSDLSLAQVLNQHNLSPLIQLLQQNQSQSVQQPAAGLQGGRFADRGTDPSQSGGEGKQSF